MSAQSNPTTGAQRVLDGFWGVLDGQAATREDAIAAAKTLWVQMIITLPPDEMEDELAEVEPIARGMIADALERRRAERKPRLVWDNPAANGVESPLTAASCSEAENGC
jgi:hypothetical protein